MSFEPIGLGDNAPPQITGLSGAAWTPMVQAFCDFTPEIFASVMENLVRNPNLQTTWLFRADILSDSSRGDNSDSRESKDSSLGGGKSIAEFEGLEPTRTVIRRLVPRNEQRDAAMLQSVTWYRSSKASRAEDGRSAAEGSLLSLVVYTPIISQSSGEEGTLDLPFYHPNVRALAFLHKWNPSSNSTDQDKQNGTLSIHYRLIHPSDAADNRLQRTALRLLQVCHKHGEGALRGYEKRVRHDMLVPQARFQERYKELKKKYAKNLTENWAESTDPGKHVFEDLGIAAFLMELWGEMYVYGHCGNNGRDEDCRGEKNERTPFPGFVDIGCGNGLLVYILQKEGYRGWGFDARSRKSWAHYTLIHDGVPSLQQKVLLPSIVSTSEHPLENGGSAYTGQGGAIHGEDVHDGVFPKGTFIISNHADELTPWTPLVAALSECPFIMIPCCSHNLSGAKFRAPIPSQKSSPSDVLQLPTTESSTNGTKPPAKSKPGAKSAYASLVEWTSSLALECGFETEREMLRIPSTRNTAVVGRRRTGPWEGKSFEERERDIKEIAERFGGCEGYLERVVALMPGRHVISSDYMIPGPEGP
jgi:tRNASer (uridine44-2'-O)-methyltransferase